MDDTLRTALISWRDYYLITGTAAAALTGLQFVVQSLLASGLNRSATHGDTEGGVEAFGTPTVVHFTLSLVLSAVMCAPWPGAAILHATVGVIGAGALVYSGVVLRRARRQRGYVPVFEDWLWHILLPASAYAAVLVAALFLGHGALEALFAIAAVTLLLLCIGIHNAWDTVTYLTLNALREDASRGTHP